MGIANVLLCLTLCAFVAAQTVDPVSVDGLSQVPVPSSLVSVDGLSEVSAASTTENPVSVNGLSEVPAATATSLGYDPGPFDSWATEAATATSVSASVSSSSNSNKGKIAGGVIGGLAVLIAAVGALVFLRFRSRRSTTHWRNRTTGAWVDQEGKAGGPVYVGQPLSRPFDGYGLDSKVSVASPTTPVFIREPRLAFSHGHTRGASSSRNRNDSIEMHSTVGSPTSDAYRF